MPLVVSLVICRCLLGINKDIRPVKSLAQQLPNIFLQRPAGTWCNPQFSLEIGWLNKSRV